MSPYKRVVSKQLGELLLERKVIDQKQLDQALEVQKGKGGFIGEILVSLSFAKEEDIAQVLTVQYGFPYLPLNNYEIDSEATKLIPKNIAKQYCLIPIDLISTNLTITMSNPLNDQAMKDIKLISKCTVQTFISTATDIKGAIEKYYKKNEAK